nr:protein POLLENLESS 3-like isoform X1 [Ipomoea trifida]
MLANDNPRGFFTPQPLKLSGSPVPASQCKPPRPHSAGKQDLFHVIHKVPAGDSPYVRAKHVQLIEKDPSRAVSLFWAAINSGDRVDSALKDMAIVMKQLNRSDEAIEAIKSFRHLSPTDSQESIDNILIELYKRSGRIEEEIEMIEHKLKNIEEGIAFGGKKTKTARSQGKKVEITLEKEYSRLLGNLAWAHMHLKNYKSAEENYRKALSLEPDKNKQCNLAICLMHMNKIAEAKFLLQSIRASSDYREMDDSCHKSLERAMEMLTEFESQNGSMVAGGEICKGRTSSTSTLDVESDSKGGTVVRLSTVDKLKRDSVSCWRKYGGGHLESSPGGGPFTQPRRCAAAWSSFNNNGHQKKGGWSKTSRKLSFESNSNTTCIFLPPPSTNEKLLRSDLGHWKNCNVMKTQSTLPKMIHDEKWRRDYYSLQNDKKKFMESISFALEEESPTVDFSSAPHFLTQNSELLDTTEHLNLIGTEKSANNEKQQSKKSWADMVEEEDEQEDMQSFETQSNKSSNSQELRDDEEEFNDENADCNVIREIPSLKNLAENISQSLETLDLNGGYYTQPEQSTDGIDTWPSSPFHGQLNFEIVKLVPPEGGDLTIQTPLRLLKRRNRLQVFQDITPDSPRF